MPDVMGGTPVLAGTRVPVQTLNAPGAPAQTAEEFWKEYDAQQAAGKK